MDTQRESLFPGLLFLRSVPGGFPYPPSAMAFQSGYPTQRTASAWFSWDGFPFSSQHGDSIHFASSFRRNNKLSFQSSWYGLPHINPHAFRHTEASVLLANGTEIVTVAAQLGHASANTTENFYAHIIEENKAKASECIADVLIRKKA